MYRGQVERWILEVLNQGTFWIGEHVPHGCGCEWNLKVYEWLRPVYLKNNLVRFSVVDTARSKFEIVQVNWCPSMLFESIIWKFMNDLDHYIWKIIWWDLVWLILLDQSLRLCKWTGAHPCYLKASDLFL